jgi:ABC-2 type transport system ATP-binding protein
MDKGRIVATGTPRELVSGSDATPSVRLWTAQPIEREWLASLRGVEDLHCEGTSAGFRTTAVSSTLAAVMTALAARGIDVTDLRVHKATLEDLFLELTGARTHPP